MEHFLSTVDPKRQARKTVSAENSTKCRQKGALLIEGNLLKPRPGVKRGEVFRTTQPRCYLLYCRWIIMLALYGFI